MLLQCLHCFSPAALGLGHDGLDIVAIKTRLVNVSLWLVRFKPAALANARKYVIRIDTLLLLAGHGLGSAGRASRLCLTSLLRLLACLGSLSSCHGLSAKAASIGRVLHLGLSHKGSERISI